MSHQLSGRTVLVTGASRGIGLASAKRFAAEGARVGLVARDSARVVAAANEIAGDTCAVAADLTEPAECARAVAEVSAALGPVDVLISNAGVLRRDFVEDVRVADFEASYRLGVGAALWLTQQVLPAMRQQGYGRIVLISSELGLVGGPSYASYCTTKFALIGLAEVLCHELSGTGIRTCAVCPGDVRTGLLEEEHKWGPTGSVPLEKAMPAEQVAEAVLRATNSRKTVIVVDRPQLRTWFNLTSGPRSLRLATVRRAYKDLLGT